MDANAQYELYLIKRELQGIVDELNSISVGVRRDFTGIGNERCADSVASVADYYQSVKNDMEKMDTSTVTEEFAAKRRAEKEEAKRAAEQAARKAAEEARKKAEEAAKKAEEAARKAAQEAAEKNKEKSNNSNGLSSIISGFFEGLFKW